MSDLKTLVSIVEAGNVDEIGSALDTLADMRKQREDMIDRAGLARIQAQVEAEIALLAVDVDKAINKLSVAIRARVKEMETTVKGQQLSAIFSTRRSWNSDWLEAYADNGHPEVLSALKKSKSVAIR